MGESPSEFARRLLIRSLLSGEDQHIMVACQSTKQATQIFEELKNIAGKLESICEE